MNEHAGVRPVHEAGVVTDHGIDHVVIVIDEAAVRPMTDWLRVRRWLRQEARPQTLHFLAVAGRLALHLAGLVHVPVLAQQSNLQLVEIPDAEIQRLVLLPRALRQREAPPGLLGQPLLQQAADPVLNVGPLEGHLRRHALPWVLLIPGRQSSLLVSGRAR